MFNKLAIKVPACGLIEIYPFRLCNIRLGYPVIADRFYIGELARYGTRTFIHDAGGRQTNTLEAAVRVTYAHQVGRMLHVSGSTLSPPLPSRVRIVCVDTCKLKWCSIDSVAFHSFVWPRNTQQAKSIARTLYTNHCNWADVLIVRGRCFSRFHACFRANRVLEHLLWNFE